MNKDNSYPKPTPTFNNPNENTPDMGGGLPIIGYWAEHTLSPEGVKLWKTLLHKSACLSCAWGTGGQKGGFTNEEGEKLQCFIRKLTLFLKPKLKSAVVLRLLREFRYWFMGDDGVI